jgi:DNA mismatch repair protein MutS
MINDRTTLKDLSFFSADGSNCIFVLLDFTTTQAGRDALRKHIHHPPDSYQALLDTQAAIRFLADYPEKWPTVISNGTIVMLEKFFESADNIGAPPSGLHLVIGTLFQKFLNKQESFYTRFSLSHLTDFLKGCLQLTEILQDEHVPQILREQLLAMQGELQHRFVQELTSIDKKTSYTYLTQLSYKVRREMKHMIYRLMDMYAKLDAWQSIARATTRHQWVFPELVPDTELCFIATGLYHPLLQAPVSYPLDMGRGKTFLLLTGANMSGKTTFMRSIGVSALLAHLGMGVPAAALRISFLHGIITSMTVEDNILNGESYFFAEVQRMKQTAEKITQMQPHLVLMDELFKGTNVHDAYECTRAVVQGLLLHTGHLMILSTHLYEVANHFQENRQIVFRYFETESLPNGHYRFSYHLREGISNDRIGYRILQSEGVLKLLGLE